MQIRIQPSAALAALAIASSFVFASSVHAIGAACPTPELPGLSGLSVIDASAATDTGGISVNGAAADTAMDEADRAAEQESALFARILAERSAVAVPSVREFPLPVAQRDEIDRPVADESVPKVGAAIDIGQQVDFSGVATGGLPRGGKALQSGVAGVAEDGAVVWESALASVGASALRLQFSDLDLQPGVELYLYNEDGQVWGPYTGRGPEGNGQLWSPATFGDVVRIHVRAGDPSSLAGSHFTLAAAMHLGARLQPLQNAIRARYAVGPSPDDIGFCGVQVPDCTIDAMCRLSSFPGLDSAAESIAHIVFNEGGSAYICTGAYLAQSGNAPQQPYFMTANHCFSTQASASSLEAYFKFRSSACGGTCPVRANVPRVNGSTLIATGALPSAPDFTFLRLSGFPAGGARLLGWDTAVPTEGGVLIHMGHPAGAPLSYSFRRVRHNNAGIPHSSNWPEPTFLYSGLASSSADWAGSISGGSSGGPALLVKNGKVAFVGQLLGHTYFTVDNTCDPNNGTVDGALQSSFPSVRRYLYDTIFRSGFERP